MINSSGIVDRTYENLQPLAADIVANVEEVIVGKSEAIQLALIALLCEGHVLLEDVPGVGKTVLVRSLAKSLGCTFKRIQFTPDLLPSDVTGISIYNQKSNEFEFRSGPIMTHVLLADEINRTSPKTQSALLEAMEEGNVTVDGVTYPLPTPFFIMATQNPIEYEGTFPLPEAQLDRFLLKIRMGYPTQTEEIDILTRLEAGHPLEQLHAVTTPEEISRLQSEVRKIYVEKSIREYMVKLSRETRQHPAVYLGVSPRGSLALFRVSQAAAFLAGRSYVVPDDVKRLVPYTMGHRIILRSEARLSGLTVDKVLQDILTKIPVPISIQKETSSS